ncbi:MAG TPA: TetR/AcrR family transcriptional regulator [Methanospirillum sp.]|nr:TetR/AcrR family transcriptional regulator [Methanospirillum sp.]
MPKVIPEYRDEARKKIILIGLEVMSQKGYHNTTLDDIASQVGVSKTTLYLYFKNKEDLIVEIIRSVHEDTHSQAIHLFQSESILDAYVHLLDLFLGRDMIHVGFIHDILALSTRNSQIRQIHQEHLNAVIENATFGITCLQQKGKVRTDVEARTMALSLISLISGMNNLHLKGIEREEIKMRFYDIGKIILGLKDPDG